MCPVPTGVRINLITSCLIQFIIKDYGSHLEHSESLPIESLQVEANGHSLQNRRIKLGIHYANTLKAYPSISARFGVFNPLY
jgi:hypothetical protein